jgi:hypothetical protein
MLFRCPECRTRRKDHKLFTQHLRATGHRLCMCGGYHFAHRKGSPYCYQNPFSAMYHASRQGEHDETLARIAQSIAANDPQLTEKAADLCKYFGVRNTA